MNWFARATLGSFLARLGSLCATNPWRVIALWTLTLAAALGLAAGLGSQPRADSADPASLHSAGYALLTSKFPDLAGADTRVVVRTRSARVNGSDLATVHERLRAVSGVSAVSAPRMSAAGDAALIAVHYRLPVTQFRGSDGVDSLSAAVAPLRRPDLQIELGGEVPENFTAPGGYAEHGGVIASGFILVLAFGSVAAAAIAAAVGLFGLGTGLALMRIVANFVPNIDATAPVITSVIGIGACIACTLLFRARFREQRPLYPSARDAAGAANRSAGVPILVAGTTVIVSLLGVRLVGIPPFATYGYATATAMVAVMAAAVTLLPALCGIADRRLLRRRLGDTSSEPAARDRAPSGRWARHVGNRPAAWATAALIVLLLLAAPVCGMRTWPRDAGSQPTSETARRAYDLTAAAFGPGANGPFTVEVDLTRVSPEQLKRTTTALRGNAGVANISDPVDSADHSAAVFTIDPTSAPKDAATADTLRRVRAQLPDGMYVTGLTAYFVDVSDLLAQRLWLLIIVVVALAAALLAIILKTPVVAITAALTNLLAAAATYGVLVALFQWGWGKAVFGLPGPVPISSWSAIMLFIVLFGLSTHYQVFIISRVREEWLNTGQARQSVMHGATSTLPIVTTAAVIMAAIFIAYSLDPDIIVKMLCVGAVAGLFIDVIVVRMILLPSTMALLGRSNWWVPAWATPTVPFQAGGTTGLPTAEGSLDDIDDART